MSKTVGIVLAIIGGIVLLGIFVVGVAGYWLYKNKDRLIQSVNNIPKVIDTAEKDAKEFGPKTDTKGCLNEAVSREKKDNSPTGRISSATFLKFCLQVSGASPGFCDNVPGNKEIMKSVNWRVAKCASAGMQNDQGCQQLLGVVQDYCQQRK